MDAAAAAKLYTEIGATGLFIVLYVVTSYMLIRELKGARKETRELTEKTVAALESASEAIKRSTECIEEIEETIREGSHQNANLLAYLEGRDQGLRDRKE
jgi:hypothetical protein